MQKAAMKCLFISAVLGAGGYAVLATSCGGSDSGTPGSGGSTGSGGSVLGSGGKIGGSGGATGSGGVGSGGQPGSGGATANCDNPAAVTNGTLTTFTAGTDWSATSGKWGAAPGLTGTVFTYGDSANGTDPLVKTIDAAGLHLSGTVQTSSYAGGGISFDKCSTVVGAFNAIQFKISGTNDGCDLELQVQNFSQKGGSGGGCPSDSSCWNFPVKKQVVDLDDATAAPQTITVPFSELSNYTDAAGAELVGVQWQFTSASPDPDGGTQVGCSPNIVIDDIKFLNQ